MATVGLISCVSRKRANATQARDIYDSSLFSKAREYVDKHCDRWFILSAKYGLVEPKAIIKPYDETLNTKSRVEREQWAVTVWEHLHLHLRPGDHIVVLAGELYREFLIPRIRQHGYVVDVPMEGLGIGRQLQWLSNQLARPNRHQDLENLYDLLRKLKRGIGGTRCMSQCNGQQPWPRSGVYFFFEPREYRSRATELRVVRVGTHAVSRGSKATLWNRLRTHRGTSDGLGNHRSSIFRLHMGAALAARDPRLAVSSWSVGQAADAEVRKKEERLERAVSEHIGEMEILWVAINDEPSPSSDRAYIERNVIGLLVGRTGPADLPSHDWLGRYSPEERIVKSGLWNLDFLDYSYSPNFLEILHEYVFATIGKISQPTKSIAPRDWYTNERQGISRNQLSLFKE